MYKKVERTKRPEHRNEHPIEQTQHNFLHLLHAQPIVAREVGEIGRIGFWL